MTIVVGILREYRSLFLLLCLLYHLRYFVEVLLHSQAVLRTVDAYYGVLGADILAVEVADVCDIDQDGGILIDIGETDETFHGFRFYQKQASQFVPCR